MFFKNQSGKMLKLVSMIILTIAASDAFSAVGLNEAHRVATKITNLYSSEFKKYNLELSIEINEDDNTVNVFSVLDHNHAKIKVLKGFIDNQFITSDALALAIFHEIGFFLADGSDLTSGHNQWAASYIAANIYASKIGLKTYYKPEERFQKSILAIQAIDQFFKSIDPNGSNQARNEKFISAFYQGLAESK